MTTTPFGFDVQGSFRIFDTDTNETLLEKTNAVNYEAISICLAATLSNRGYGTIFEMAFGNGASLVDATGLITYLPPNVKGINAALYSQTYSKIVDDTLVANDDPTKNLMSINHVNGRLYTDILVQSTLTYGEPAGQQNFDNGVQSDDAFTFDELGLVANLGTSLSGDPIRMLITHAVFAPIQKSLNRQIAVEYTLRIQSLTNLITI